MVEELVDYRLARYLFTKGGGTLEAALRLKVIQASGQPILMLDRGRNPQLPEGEASFIANDVIYTGNFAKIALNVAHRAGRPDNALAGLLRSWFGADAGQPGTVQYVELVPGEPHWQMRPASPALAAASPPADVPGGLATGLPGPVTVRALAACPCLVAARGGADLEVVKERLGHSSIVTTQKYLGTQDETYETAVDALIKIRSRGMKSPHPEQPEVSMTYAMPVHPRCRTRPCDESGWRIRPSLLSRCGLGP